MLLEVLRLEIEKAKISFEELNAKKAGPGRYQHVRKNIKMNSLFQTRILLMYLILINTSDILHVGLQLDISMQSSEQ